MHDVEFDVVANQYSLRPRADPGAVIAHSGTEGNHVVASRRIAAGSLVLRARGFDLPLGHEQDPSVLLQAVLSKCAVVRYCLLSYGSNPSHMREASYGPSYTRHARCTTRLPHLAALVASPPPSCRDNHHLTASFVWGWGLGLGWSRQSFV